MIPSFIALRPWWKRRKKVVETLPAKDVRPNRAEIRAFIKSRRRRGAGWTKPYRKGRDQRHPKTPIAEEN